MLNDPEIELIVNLTFPQAHTEVNLAALEAGKNVYCEKPFALNLEDGKKTIECAKKKGLIFGCAPDTFLGAGLQTCRKVLDEGWIGEPVAATANFVCQGHEIWHPSPQFYYEPGGGPLFDMGPYYITALVVLLGSIKKVGCFAKKTFDKRTILSRPLKGEKLDVHIPTHYSGLLEFGNNVIANINLSFDVWLSNLPRIEIYGTQGTLCVSDPNMFHGPVKVMRSDKLLEIADQEGIMKIIEIFESDFQSLFEDVPLPYLYSDHLRGLGVLDMAYALRTGRKHRVNEELAYHVLDTLCTFDKAAQAGKEWEVESRCDRPAPIPLGLRPGVLDD
jgi:predicted dehydrogenase